jgi:hypothetical protein
MQARQLSTIVNRFPAASIPDVCPAAGRVGISWAAISMSLRSTERHDSYLLPEHRQVVFCDQTSTSLRL